ncbi:MAG: glycosyltransferase family 1 protein [Acidobacteria bacterium]|nr:glycosyltransferase family 1 protein [Acidobacteriota bacterium]
MRVLLSTIGSRGDVQPLVALALTLRVRGHQVRVCVPPDFREWIEGFGLDVRPIGPRLPTAMAAAEAPAGPPSRDRRREMAEASVATQFDTIAAAAEGCDAIVAATALQIAARSIAERMGIRYVFAAYTPNVLPSPHHAPPVLPPVPGEAPPPATADTRELWARDTERFNDLFGPALNAHRTSMGLSPVHDVRSYMFTDRPWLAADPVLGPWSDREAQPVFQTGAWILPDERPLPRDVDAFLDAGEPPIYFGFGSARPPRDLDPVTMRLEAARAVGRRAIVSRGWADLPFLDNQPDCLAVGDTNLQALFPRVAAVVHHGGAGTTCLTALAGAPHVVVPQVYDQHYWARRVEELGIGAAHTSGELTVEALTSALDRALQPAVASHARSVAAGVRRDGVHVAAEALAA